MHIKLNNAGKRFNREWIFRHVDLEFRSSVSYAITGPNGSGKSTLLQVIAGAQNLSEGKILYSENTAGNKRTLNDDEIFRHVSIAAPYLELVEEMTASEMIGFHRKFKQISTESAVILQETGLELSAGKQIRYFSSGMKQRLKLGLAFFSNTPVLCLDEPTTNLDADGISLYKRLVQNHNRNRLLLISSNDPSEYDFCDHVIDLAEYKA